MAYNIFVQKQKNKYCVVFPKCGWTLFHTHCRGKQANFIYVNSNQFPAQKVHIDAFFIRHPVDRIISGFKNKYLDNPDKDIWTRDWLIKIMNLQTKEQIKNISFDQFLDRLQELVFFGQNDFKTVFFRGDAPDNYWDTHFCPLSYQLRFFPQKEMNFFDIRKDLDYLDYLGINYSIKHNSSSHIAFEATPEQKKRIEEIYKDDMILYKKYEKDRANRQIISS